MTKAPFPTRRFVIALILLGVASVVLDLRQAPKHSMRVNSPGLANVVMFGTSNCGYCRQARYFFDQYAIPYFEYDLDRSEEARREFAKRGGFATPLILIGERQVPGFQQDLLFKLLVEKKTAAPR